ncbi:MAG: hypothetical protein ACOX6C_01665 [Patescibacteria group bacterium]|jgi:hypothetical protein
MKNSLSSKIKAGSLLLLLLSAFFVFNLNLQPAQAVPTVTAEVSSIPQILADTKLTLKEKLAKIWKTFGANLIGTTVRNTLNRVAIDAAKYVASAGEGQKPTYVVEDFSEYWKNIGDAAAGDFIDGLGQAWEADLCQPPSPNIQAKIGLGLVQTLYPDKPDCTLSNLVNNYSSAYEKLAAMESGDYLKGIKASFDPGGSELSAAFTLFGRVQEVSTKAEEDEKDKNTITQGWLDVRNIAGKLESAPGQARDDLEGAKDLQRENLLKTTGDALVDATNIFLNQLAYESFQRVMREINKGKSTSQPLDISRFDDLRSSGFESLVQYGETIVSEKLSSVVKPRFDVRGDYSILGELVACPDLSNPGPNNCVIDDKFSQAIANKLTVGEALKEGYLHGDWQISGDPKSESTYNTRSASILRKYRIVPITWEEAFNYVAENNVKATFQDLVSCFDGSDDYNQFSSDFTDRNASWCQGKIDPNWVLKAPLNYCAKEGAGSQILSSYVSPEVEGVSSLMISRATDYCADNQTCIKEKVDGSCELYGYCNEERRTWRFNTDTCEPVFNTCQTFTNATDNQALSFLENTLDYSTCDANNVGCREYYAQGSYNPTNGSFTWDKNYPLFLNNRAPSCEASDEGCTQFLRGKPGWDEVNYVMDGGFLLNQVGDTNSIVNWHWPLEGASVAGEIVNDGGKALQVSGGNGVMLYSDEKGSVLPKNMTAISNWSYTLSADVKIISGDKLVLTFGGPIKQVETSSRDWVRLSITQEKTTTLNFYLTGYGSNVKFLVRNLKLTPNGRQTAFSYYGKYPIYQKLLPNYLESLCYTSSATGNYTLKEGAPAVCSDYARKCNKEDVGCEFFRSVGDNFEVAAKANESDYCDSQCDGYDVYIAKESSIFSASADNVIPELMTACAASEAGCASFTNLDKVEQGGEGIEYYSQLKQCVKPQEASCGDFYSWDNSQLVVMSLRQNPNGLPYLIDSDTSADCSKDIYNLPPSDPRYNPDCREFYSKDGRITYHLISETVTCSNNCNSYRLNTKNYDSTLKQSECTGVDKSWDDFIRSCQVCKNGGLWDPQQKACVYKAIPQEGKTCGAASVGCREYNGKKGNALRMAETYTFEGQTGFSGGTLNSDSIFKEGQSLAVSGTAFTDAENYAKEGAAYTLKFLAKPLNAGASLRFSFVNADNEVAVFGVTPTNDSGDLKLNGGWQTYELSLGALDHRPGTERLRVETTGGVLLDNLVVSEITDRYYLVKGSSAIPDVCSYDINDVYRGPNYNLGCAGYADRSGGLHYLRQFSELCRDSAVGCELLVQTNNNSNFFSFTYNQKPKDSNWTSACEEGAPGCHLVPGNEAVYMIFDQSKQCNQAATGCTRLGTIQNTLGVSSWGQTFKRLQPDLYRDKNRSPLCQVNEVGCDAWLYENGSASYFKNPGTNTCFYRNGKWLQTPVKRCDANNNGQIDKNENTGVVCVSNADCGGSQCLTDENDYECLVDYGRTLGLNGNLVPSPRNKVGLCSAEASGCTEYIDPLSEHASNLLYNPTGGKVDGNDRDGWSSGYQEVTLKANRLYTISTDGSVSGLRVVIVSEGDEENELRPLDQQNFLSAPTREIVVSNNQALFYVQNLISPGGSVRVRIYRSSYGASVYLREAIINYQLKAQLDLQSCNGLVDVDNGCVLFNERSQSGANGLRTNIYSALGTKKGQAPASCSGNDCTANQIIKVEPDRVCSNWLSCQTYVEDPETGERTCYKIGECNELDDKNECSSFISHTNSNRDPMDPNNKNTTGYALLDNYYLGQMKEVGGHAEATFTFETNAYSLSCRRDIDVSSSSKLWAERSRPCVFDKGISGDSLVLSPDQATTDYPAEGVGYLKVLNYYQISPHAENSPISVSKGKTYFINYLVNTKNSNASAKLIITDDKNQVIATFVDRAAEGWERKIKKFTAPSSGLIKIFLTSDADNLAQGYVYFDDIYIEPVLQVGDNKYIAKECRLYPEGDSLSCLSVNNNVIKDGLYGYCLERDPANPKVCQLWYPVDQISPVARVYQSELGYNGKFPLYYCTEVDGNFSLVEKRVGKFHAFGARENYSESWLYKELGFSDGKPSLRKCNSAEIVNGTDGCLCSNSASVNTTACGDGYTAVFAEASGKSSGLDSDYMVFIYCIPKQSELKIKTERKLVNTLSYLVYSGSSANCDFEYYDGWAPYNDLYNKPFVYARDPSTDEQSEFDTNNLENINESKNAEGTEFSSIMVLPSGQSAEGALKHVANSNNTIDSFKITCNKFSQFAGDQGESVSWTNRISRNTHFSETTPTFFSSIYNSFGRNRADVPFGSAVLPDDFTFEKNGAVYLRNQYSQKNNETIFAGRPYGCTGSGCANIGYCELDPNVYCLYKSGDTEFNKLTCAARGGGACKPLWGSIPSEATAMTQLNNLFVNRYNNWIYNKASDSYTLNNSGAASFVFARQMSPIAYTDNHPNNLSQKVKPSINNVKLSGVSGDNISVSGGRLNVATGLYRLNLNTKVNLEQQPLKRITIDWGDGTVQTVGGLDYKPDPNIPHTFYHYYLKNNYQIKIKAEDNWGAWQCLESSGSGWSENSNCDL